MINKTSRWTDLKRIISILILISTFDIVLGQNPQAQLYINILYNGVLYPIDTVSFNAARQRKRHNDTDTIYSLDRRFVILLGSIKGNWETDRNDAIRGKVSYYIHPPMLYSSFSQNFVWRGDSEVKITDTKANETMDLIVENIIRKTFINLNFKKGKYRYDMNNVNTVTDTPITVEVNQNPLYRYAQEKSLKQYYLGKAIDLQRWKDSRSAKSYTMRYTKPSDSAFVRLKNQTDTGHSYYYFQKYIPDGEYLVYIDGSLDKAVSAKNGTITCHSVSVGDTLTIKWKKFVINTEKVTGVRGHMILSTNKKGEIYNPLNLSIINGSEYLFDKPLDFKLNSEKTMRQIFLDEMPENYNDLDAPEDINTEIAFNRLGILSYKIQMDYRADKGSPYVEYINIDLKRNKEINIYDVIDSTKRKEFLTFLFRYETDHKREMVKKRVDVLAQRADQLLYEEQIVYAKPGYDLKKVLVMKADTAHIINLQEKGMEIETNIRDINFKKYKDGNEYPSSVFVPYQLMLPYFNKRAPLYNIIIQLNNNQ